MALSVHTAACTAPAGLTLWRCGRPTPRYSVGGADATKYRQDLRIFRDAKAESTTLSPTTAPVPPPSRPPRPSFIRAASETRPSSTQQPLTVRGEPVRSPRRAVSNHTAPATNPPRPSPAIPASPAGTQHPDHCQRTKATPTSQYLDVDNYGLYPGDRNSDSGLHIRFQPGLTLLLGANGLGKTTLVNMLYRLLTGPYDIPALRTGAELGTASLKVTPLRGRRRRTFSHRVADGGASATARLEFNVGSTRVLVERYLRDLKLRSFRIDDSELAHNEGRFQWEMSRLANVSTFGDWILLLRYIIFYFEDRRSLVWDPDAQRQLLRILFLDPSRASEWTDREREILEEESRVRNLRAATTREARELARHEEVAADAPRIRQQLRNSKSDNESTTSLLKRSV